MIEQRNFLAVAGIDDPRQDLWHGFIPSRDHRSRLQWLVRENKCDRCAPINLALNPGRSVVKIDNRLYQSQTQPCSIRSARRLCAVKPIEHTRQMFGCNSAASIADCDLEIGGVLGNRDLN